MVGQRVNNFEIRKLLGEGGMGAVYEAEHPMIRRKVAVKVLRRELAVDRGLVQRFFNEARAANSIRHPNIVEVIDLGTLPDGVPYLIMELLEGESLSRRLQRLKQTDVPFALEFGRQAASALEAAHANGIVHRDIKPDNIFLVPDQRFAGRELVKVLDFGIAKLRGDLSTGMVQTNIGSVFGTPPYMSPEQCRGLPSEIDHRTDIYALGIILYEMLCGEPPFIGVALGDVMMMHMGSTPVPPTRHRPDIPTKVEKLILKALAKKREDRFQSMAELMVALGPRLPSGNRAPGPESIANVHPSANLEAVSGPIGPKGAGANVVATPSAGGPTTLTHATGEMVALSTLREADSAGHAQDQAARVGRIPSRDPAGRREGSRSRRGIVIGGVMGALVLIAGVIGLRVLQEKPAISQSHAVPTSIGSAAQNREARRPGVAREATSPSPETHPAEAPMPADSAKASPITNAEAVHVLAHSPSRRLLRPRKPQPALANAPEAPQAPSSETTVLQVPQVPARRPAVEPAAELARPSSALGYLSLDTAPWSNVYLGGKLLGATPLMRYPLPAGRHVLTLKNPEAGTSASYVVEIKSGASVSRFVGLEKE